MKTSIRCFIFGHKWNLVSKVYRDKVRAADPNEPLIYDRHYKPLPFCHHCGQPNPGFQHAVNTATVE